MPTKIEIDWEPELLGGRYIAGISFYDSKTIPSNAPAPGIGETKEEAIGCFIMNAAEYLGLEVDDVSGRELGGREATKHEPEKPKCFGDWHPGSMICIRTDECDVWQECTAIWRRKKEWEGAA